MRQWAVAALAALGGLAAGCGSSSSGTYLVVEVRSGDGAATVPAIELQIDFGGRRVQKQLEEPGGGDITLPTTASYRIPSGAGAVTVSAIARDRSGRELARGSGAGTITRDETTTVVVTLGQDVMLDGGVDGALDDGGATDAARLAVERTSFDFGTAVLGGTSPTQGFVFTNQGTGSSGALTSAVSGVDFTIATDDCAGQPLPAGGTCTVVVRFAPGGAGASTGSLHVSASPGGDADVALSGAGVGPGVLTLLPATRDFGTVVDNGNSPTATFVISNGGGASTGTLAVALTGSDAPQFAVTSDGCGGQTLAASASCTVTVRLSPITPGAKSATLTVAGAPGGTAVAALSGRGVVPGVLSTSPNARDFGAATVGSLGTPVTFTVINTGLDPTGALGAALTGAEADQFAILADACTGMTIVGGSSCTLQVRHSPTRSGTQVAGLLVSGAPGGATTSALSAVGLRPATLAILPPSQDYAGVVAGNTSATTFSISNTGQVASGALTTIVTGADAAQFVMESDGCFGRTLDPGVSCTTTVRFTPTGAGARQAALAVSASPGGSSSAALTGSALAPGALSLAPSSHDFGSLVQNSAGADFAFTVTNTGGSPTGALAVTLGGTAASQFAIGSDTCMGQLLAAAASCTVNVHFAPATPGNKTASLSVVGAPGGTAAAALSGLSIAQAALGVSPGSFQYPAVVHSTAGAAQAFTVTNSGGVISGGLTVSLGGADPTQFSISGNSCGTGALAAGASCMVTVQFLPTSAGAKAAALNVTAAPGGTAAATLTGTGLTPPALTLTPSPQDFGGVLVGAFADRTLTVTNTGQGTSGALTLGFTGGDTGMFTRLTPTGAECVTGTTTLLGGASCSFRVRFTPSSRGAKTTSATATATPGTSASATLSGTGQSPAQLSGSPATLTLATTATGATSATMSWTLTNTGDVATGTPAAPVKAGSHPGEFTTPTNTCTAPLAPLGTCSIAVAFAPTTGGAKSATLALSASPGGSASVNLAGTATIRLTVTKVGTGTVTSMPAGISCGATCAANFTAGASVILQARPSNNSGFYFQGWSGGGCSGAFRDCTVTADVAKTVTATFASITNNLVFVSSATYLGAAVGSATNADTLCNGLATSAGINTTAGTYVAILSDASSNVRTRLGASTRGFVRLDGRPFADDQTGLFGGAGSYKLFYPLNLDETGAPVSGSPQVWTGSLSDGTTASETCSNWTSSAAGVSGHKGRLDGGSRFWIDDGAAVCSTTGVHLYCAMKTKTVAVAPPAVAGAKRIYLSNTGYIVGATTPDAKCTADKPGTIAGAVKALIATTTQSPFTLLSAGTTYVRMDSAVVGTGAQIVASQLQTGIWQTGSGAYPNPFYVWTGANGSPSTVGSSATTCGNWAGTGGTGNRAAFVFLGEWWLTRGDPCTNQEPIYCFEQ